MTAAEFAVRAVAAYVAAEPDNPEVVKFKEAWAALRDQEEQ